MPQKLDYEFGSNGLVKVDEFEQTGLPKVYAIGDMSRLMQQIALAVSSGVMAASAINRALLLEDFS